MPGKKRAQPDAPPEEEEAFPRGRASVLTPLEERKLKLQATADFERESLAGVSDGKKKKAKTIKAIDAEEDSFFKTQSSAGRLPKFVELLRFTNLSVGAKVWGAVLEVTHKRLIVALPHGLRGVVAPADASDVLRSLLTPSPSKADKVLRATLHTSVPSLPDLFYPGQFVRCVVSALDDCQDGDGDKGDGKKGDGKKGKGTRAKRSKQVHLSLCLADVCKGTDKASFPRGAMVPAVVRTLEEHGCTLETGVPGVSAFLPRAAFAAAFGPEARAVPGALLQVVVKESLRGGGSLVMDCGAAAVAAASTQEFYGITLNSLLPGQLVTVTVRNVLSDGLLVSFLKYFHGVIDQFHLPLDKLATWRSAFKENQRLQARILYVDAATKQVRLSLHKHLVAYHLPVSLPVLGEAYTCKVLRADAALGLLLQLPTQPAPSLGYVHISNVADATAPSNLAKAYPAGTEVAAKVIGFRPMDALATMTARPSAVASGGATWASLAAGAVVDGTVHAIEDYGLVVALSPAVRALVPLAHVSEVASTTKKAQARFKLGQAVRCRVMDVDAGARRCTLTLKRGLIDSKLQPITSAAGVAPGARAHGWVTGVTDKGVFVEFYNKVKGLVPPAEAGLAPGVTPVGAYTVGQVLRVTVLGADSKKGLRLSIASGAAAAAKAAAASAGDRLGGLREGQVIEAVPVVRVTPAEGDPERASALYLEVPAPGVGTVIARLAVEHLSDHPYAADALARVLQPGMTLPRVLVLERREQAGLVTVTRKAAMLAAASAGQLPARPTDVHVGAVVPGFIASVTKDACFVRFAGGLTGRAGLPQVADAFVTDPALHFAPGQSVTAHVTALDAQTGRLSVSLKPSVVSQPTAQLLATLFEDMELVAALAQEADTGPAVGTAIDVTATEEREYGLVCDVDGDDKFVGLVTAPHAPAAPPVPGQRLRAAVLDVHLLDGIVDLSAKPALVASCSAPGQQQAAVARLAVGDAVEAVVELVKQDAAYLVASLPRAADALAYVPTCDYNVQHSSCTRVFKPGQRIAATVAHVAGCRVLLHTALAAPALVAPSRKKGKALPGAIVTGKVTAVHAMHADVQVGTSKGRIHVTEVLDCAADAVPGASPCPLKGLSVGQEVQAVVLGAPAATGAKLHRLLELSLRPAAVAAAAAGSPVAPGVAWDTLRAGDCARGFVQEVAAGHLFVSLSPGVRGRVHLLHAAADPRALDTAKAHFRVGAMVAATVVAVDAAHQQLDLSLLPRGKFAVLPKGGANPEKGALVMAKIKAVSGGGVRCQLANGAVATAGLTDLHDAFVPNALQGLVVGKHVRGAVVVSDGAVVRLSLKRRDGGAHAGHEQPAAGPDTPAHGAAAPVSKGELVHGYVKSAHPAGSKAAGVYVTLSATQDARIKLSLLADHFVDDPVAAFPPGRHVHARVLDASGGRVDLTLKSTQTGDGRWQTLTALEVGQVVAGRVKRVEKFGVFVDLANSMLTGLAHVSELGDGFVKDPAARFQAGDAVRAIVLKKNGAKGQISLGLKPSYFGASAARAAGGADGATAPDAGADEGMHASDDDDDDGGAREADINLEDAIAAAFDASEDEDMDDGSDDEDVAGGSDGDAEEAGSGAGAEEAGSDDEDSAAPDTEAESVSDGNDAPSELGRAESGQHAGPSGADPHGWDVFAVEEAAATADAPEEREESRLSKRAKKRAREEREAAVRRAELARLQEAAPKSTAEFEQAVLASPNSSYVWIRFMAFLLNMAEVSKARAVAERALETIDYREQNEKFNVWLAYLNLENMYADSPEEATSALLSRALQYNDAKKMYLAAIDLFARTGRSEMLASCVKGVRRKYAQSCKVWLRLLALSLADGKDPSPVLERAVQSLAKRKHVKFLSRAALAELKDGSPDRGRALFENLLQTYPKRTDLWGMYIDQEVKAGDTASIRNLFERTIHLTLPAKKMRYFFKRYVAYESEHGTAERVAYVKKCAMDYIQAQG